MSIEKKENICYNEITKKEVQSNETLKISFSYKRFISFADNDRKQIPFILSFGNLYENFHPSSLALF